MQLAIQHQPHALGELFAKLGESNPGLLAQIIQHLRDAESEQKSPYPPLRLETRDAVDTHCAAYHLKRSPQTMRIWACKENGPLRPIRIHGRLHWKTADLRRLLGAA